MPLSVASSNRSDAFAARSRRDDERTQKSVAAESLQADKAGVGALRPIEQPPGLPHVVIRKAGRVQRSFEPRQIAIVEPR